MNTRQSFAEWLNLFPEKYGGKGNENSPLLPIVEYFFMAVEDGAFNEFGVVCQEKTIIYRGQKYDYPFAFNQRNQIQRLELLFQSLMGFSPREFTIWGDLSIVPRGKFAQAIHGNL